MAGTRRAQAVLGLLLSILAGPSTGGPPPDWRLANHQVLKQRPTAHLLDQAFGAIDEARLAISAGGQRAGAADGGTHAPA